MYHISCPFSIAQVIPKDQSRAEANTFLSLQGHYLQYVDVSASPNPQAGEPLLVGCLQLLIQYIHSYPPYRRPFLHPQPEDVPCCGDRDPLTMDYFP